MLEAEEEGSTRNRELESRDKSVTSRKVGTRHRILGYPQKPKPGLCQPPVPSSKGQGRSEVLIPQPSFRKKFKTKEPVQFHVLQSTGIKKQFGRSERVDNILGDFYRKEVSYPLDCVDEQAHICECLFCQNWCYRLSERAVGAFLRRQLQKSKGFIQDLSPRPGPHDGCLRLWLEWSHSAIRYRGYLVGIGSVQVHQREGVSRDHILHVLHEVLPGWRACGHPQKQRGSLFIFKENGFPAFPLAQCTSQAVSVFLSESGHYTRGPTYSGHAFCPCGRRVEGQTQCHERVPGPRNFVILFQRGSLETKCSGRLMCYQGEYKVQPICFSLSRKRPKVCGMGCQGKGLVSFPASLPVPSSPRGLCFNTVEFQRDYKSIPSRRVFPVPDDQRRDSREKIVSRLLDVGLVDIPFSHLSEQVISSSVSPPSTASVSPPLACAFPPSAPSDPAKLGPPAFSMMQVRSRRFKGMGLDGRSRKILKKQFSTRTINQYSGAWSRFSAYVLREGIPKAEVTESTVLNYLSSRLRDPAKKGKGKVQPMTLKTELYGLLPSLWASNNIEISTTYPYSLTKMFFSALVNLPTKKIDVFPEWDLKDLLDYLESPVFEPMSSKSLELCRVKAIILMMLATGRRLDDIQACQSWTPGTSSDGTEFISFKPFDTWKGKAVNSKDGWRPKDVVIYPIEVSETCLNFVL